MNFRPLQTLIFLFVILFLVSSCGRKNQPEQLEPNGYPHAYPETAVEVIN